MSEHDNENVGYGRPPAGSRFKPGKSGNPKGRPKGSRNFRTDLMETLKAPIHVKENGNLRKLSTQQAALFRLREKALKGDSRSLNRLLDLAAHYNGETLTIDSAETVPDEDQAILDHYLGREPAFEDGRAAANIGDDDG